MDAAHASTVPSVKKPTVIYYIFVLARASYLFRLSCRVIIPAICFRSHVRVSARLQPSPEHAPDQRAAEPGRRQRRVDGRRQRSRGRVAAPAAPSVRVAVAGHEPGDAEGPRPELHAHTQGRTGTGRVPAVPVQRGLPLRALRLPGTPDALPLHAPGLRLQFLRQDPVRAAHGQAREVTEYNTMAHIPPLPAIRRDRRHDDDPPEMALCAGWGGIVLCFEFDVTVVFNTGGRQEGWLFG